MALRWEARARKARVLNRVPFTILYIRFLEGNSITNNTTNSAYKTSSQVMMAHTMPQASLMNHMAEAEEEVMTSLEMGMRCSSCRQLVPPPAPDCPRLCSTSLHLCTGLFILHLSWIPAPTATNGPTAPSGLRLSHRMLRSEDGSKIRYTSWRFKKNKHKKNKNSKNLAASCQVSFIVQAVTGSVFHSDCFCFFYLLRFFFISLLYKTNTTSYSKLICKFSKMLQWLNDLRCLGTVVVLPFCLALKYFFPPHNPSWHDLNNLWNEQNL